MKVQPAEMIVTDEEITPISIRNAMRKWIAMRDRFEVLYRYYIGDQDFAEIHQDGNMIVANFCQYIAQAIRGYMVGNEPKYVCAEDDAYGRGIIDLMHRQVKSAVDSQLALDMSIYGKAFELVFLPKGKDEPDSVVVSPRNAFVAYTGDMERDSVFGAVVYQYETDNNETIYRLYLYSRTDASVWEGRDDDTPDAWHLIQGPDPHGFGRVPLIEYRNDKDFIGDFEGIMGLQDAYNALLSDRQDDKDAFAQSMLAIQGSIIGATQEEIEEGKTFLKKTKVLQLDEDSTASWLIKTMDESGIQILQDQYSSAIHKFAMVPDLSDEQFSGNASGIAMAYKMFGTDQKMAEKTTQFRKGFIRRCKLYDWRMHNPANSETYKPLADIEEMDIIFQFNAPQDLSYLATSLSTLTGAGIMSKQTARMQISAIPDIKEEEEQVRKESEESAQQNADAFEDDFTNSLSRARDEPVEDEDDDEEDE